MWVLFAIVTNKSVKNWKSEKLLSVFLGWVYNEEIWATVQQRLYFRAVGGVWFTGKYERGSTANRIVTVP